MSSRRRSERTSRSAPRRRDAVRRRGSGGRAWMQGDVGLARHGDGYRFQAERPMEGDELAVPLGGRHTSPLPLGGRGLGWGRRRLPGRSADSSRRTWLWDGSWCFAPPNGASRPQTDGAATRKRCAFGKRTKVRNSEAGAVQSTRPSFGRHRKSEGRIARRSRQ